MAAMAIFPKSPCSGAVGGLAFGRGPTRCDPAAMLFNSWSFAVFLPLVFLVHYLGRTTAWQLGVLTAASFAFYGWTDPSLVPLLVASTFINGLCAQQLLTPGMAPARRRLALRLGLGFNLGALAFYKYAALLAGLVVSREWSEALHEVIPLPIGISFYTFQGISLILESWWAGERGLAGLTVPPPGSRPAAFVGFHARIWFFKAFFPQLVAGPIVKAGEFLHQIGAKTFRDIDWNDAVRRLVLGFFLKCVVADNLKDETAVLNGSGFLELPRWNLVALLYGFSFQILADFAGYSLIAMGLARLFGYQLPINFDSPYISRSFTEFWRRWHISLSSWLRQYLYLPLGGNRRGAWRTQFNLFVVMFLGGLWHGAAWSYAIWGTAHGLLLAIERVVRGDAKLEKDPPWTVFGVIRALMVFSAVSGLWLLFKLPRFSEVIAFGRAVVHNGGSTQTQPLFVIALFSLPVVAWHVWSALRPWRRRLPSRWKVPLETAIYAAALLLVLTNSGSAGDFIYFQF